MWTLLAVSSPPLSWPLSPRTPDPARGCQKSPIRLKFEPRMQHDYKNKLCHWVYCSLTSVTQLAQALIIIHVKLTTSKETSQRLQLKRLFRNLVCFTLPIFRCQATFRAIGLEHFCPNDNQPDGNSRELAFFTLTDPLSATVFILEMFESDRQGAILIT